MTGCGEMFARNDDLNKHYLEVHGQSTPRKGGSLGAPKRGAGLLAPSPSARRGGMMSSPSARRGGIVPSPTARRGGLGMQASSASPRKRKVSEMDYVTPIIEAMPPEIARRNRAVFDGPSRTFTIGVGQERKRRRGN
jgi:hypothetical protein